MQCSALPSQLWACYACLSCTQACRPAAIVLRLHTLELQAASTQYMHLHNAMAVRWANWVNIRLWCTHAALGLYPSGGWRTLTHAEQLGQLCLCEDSAVPARQHPVHLMASQGHPATHRARPAALAATVIPLHIRYTPAQSPNQPLTWRPAKCLASSAPVQLAA